LSSVVVLLVNSDFNLRNIC